MVLNNAGWGAIGEVEGTSDDQARAMVEVRISTMINILLDQLIG